MDLATTEREIDGLKVSTTQLGAWRALDLTPRIGAVLAPALEKLAGMPAATITGADLELIAPVLGALFARTNGKEVQALVKDLLVSTSVIVDGRKVELTSAGAIDSVFGARLMTLLRVVWFVLTVNYSDFIGAAGMLQQVGRAAATPSPST